MINDRINRRMLKKVMIQDRYMFEWKNQCNLEIWDEEIDELINFFFNLFQAETMGEIQKEINLVLTTSKHLLPFDKKQLQWFQHSLSRIRHVRGAIKN